MAGGPPEKTLPVSSIPQCSWSLFNAAAIIHLGKNYPDCPRFVARLTDNVRGNEFVPW
jgi:hypothetical protein